MIPGIGRSGCGGKEKSLPLLVSTCTEHYSHGRVEEMMGEALGICWKARRRKRRREGRKNDIYPGFIAKSSLEAVGKEGGGGGGGERDANQRYLSFSLPPPPPIVVQYYPTNKNIKRHLCVRLVVLYATTTLHNRTVHWFYPLQFVALQYINITVQYHELTIFPHGCGCGWA